MDIIKTCLEYFSKIDLDFDLYIIADTQNKTSKMDVTLNHADESEFFSRDEFSEIASALFYVFGFAKVFYSELEFIEYIIAKKPLRTDCYIYNFSRDGSHEGKKSLIPAFCDLCNLRYTGSNAFIISLLRNKFFFSKLVTPFSVLVPDSEICIRNSFHNLERFIGKKIIMKNIFESASQGLTIDNCFILESDHNNKLIELMNNMHSTQILIQEYIDGPECEVLVLQFQNSYYALDPVEIVLEDSEFLDSVTSNNYSYSFRELGNSVNSNTIQQIKTSAVRAAEVLKIKDYARFDFRIKEDLPYLIDIAGTPYTIEHSSIAYLFEDIYHLKYNDIYKTIMACSISNQNISP